MFFNIPLLFCFLAYGLTGNKALTGSTKTISSCTYDNYDKVVVKKTKRPQKDDLDAILFQNNAIASPFSDTNRYEFTNDATNKKLSITLKNAKHEDSGTFVCGQLDGSTFTMKTSIEWTVIPDIPKSVVIKEKLGNGNLADLKSKYSEGEDLYVECDIVMDSSIQEFYDTELTLKPGSEGQEFEQFKDKQNMTIVSIQNSPEALKEFEIKEKFIFMNSPVKLTSKQNSAVVHCSGMVKETKKDKSQSVTLNVERKYQM